MKVTFFFTSTKVGFQLQNIGYVDGKGWGYIDMIDIKMTDKIWSLKKSGIV